MIRCSPYLLILGLFFLLPAFSPAQSPFHAPHPPSDEKQQQKSFSPGGLLPDRITRPVQKAMGKIIIWQAVIRQKSGTYARQIRDNPWGAAFWSYLGLAFVYGIIHALGPGHGKMFVGTYFLSRKASLRQVILMGSTMSFLHVLSAVILVILFYFIVKGGGLKSVDAAGLYLQKISAGLIFIVGLFLAGKSARIIHAGPARDDPVENHETPSSLESSPRDSDTKSVLSLALAVGLVPCPGAALILFFSITLDILAAGIAAMLFLSLGLAVTTVSFALVALIARNAMAGLTAGKTKPGAALIPPRLYHLPALIGALFISLLGAVLFFYPLM